jgi:hypothetical protein
MDRHTKETTDGRRNLYLRFDHEERERHRLVLLRAVVRL